MHTIFRIILLSSAITLLSFTGRKSQTPKSHDTPPPFLSDTNSVWVDSVFKTLSLDEKIAQLIMYPVYSKKDTNHRNEIATLIKKYGIGGIIYMQGGPVRQAQYDNYLQRISKIPILTSIDGEWGLSMRLDSTTSFPRQMMLGAIQDNRLIYEMGKEIGRQCRELNIHVDFAPVIDVNVNPKNPVINNRSFGENKVNVAKKGIAYMKGLQDSKVLASAKHFPGHGDTDVDSHVGLPVIKHDKDRLDSVELSPFKALIDSGVGSIMVAHLYIPAYDKTKNQASTLSPNVVQKLLKTDLHFQGVTFTDALNMKGVSQYYQPGEVDAKALLAGNDILLFSQDVGKAIEQIKVAITKKQISVAEIDRRVKKVLALKQWAGLDHYKPIKTDSLYERLNTPYADVLNRQLTEAAITLIKNNNNILPIADVTKRFASVSISDGMKKNEFSETFKYYANVDHFDIGKSADSISRKLLIDALKKYDAVFIGVHGTNNSPGKNFGITNETINLIGEISKNQKVVLALFANPYCLQSFEGKITPEALIISYEDNKITRDYTAQAIFGGIGLSGKLPVTGSSSYPSGCGLTTKKKRLKYSVPEDEGMNSEYLRKIDSIAYEGINNKAFPGCQVLVARNGDVVFWKAYGKQTYNNKSPLSRYDIYDLASVTKVTATVPAFMKLDELDSVSLDMNLCDYLQYVDSTQCININLREMLAHQAQLISWIPFFKNTLRNGKPDTCIYQPVQSDSFPIFVANNLYMRKDYVDSIRIHLINTPLSKTKTYKYSDLGYYFLKDIVEKYSGTNLDKLADSLFYKPLGATTLGYKPLDRFPISDIVPTEIDSSFRKQLIHGVVNDPGAAMMGGVAGHAGLFSNANDLAKMFQMYLNNGEYGGIRYLDSAVIAEYTRCQFCDQKNRRGAGFDRPSGDSFGPTYIGVGPKSYGHSGFTGTFAWADPETQIVYIFLSNRTYPDPNNTKLTKMNIRTRIQEVIYKSIEPAKAF
ncbi:MAG: glycoside hydrolase family 3 N-terminal domain-containing protein [Flavobacteriales bacterium]